MEALQVQRQRHKDKTKVVATCVEEPGHELQTKQRPLHRMLQH